MKNFFTEKIFPNPAKSVSAGFILVEALAAVSLLLMVLPAAMSAAISGVSVGSYSKNQVTASYLAQEGIEIIRLQRDNNMLCILFGNCSGVSNWSDIILSQCGGVNGCRADFGYGVAAPVITACTFASCPSALLNVHKTYGLYAMNTGTDWIPSIFKRIIKITSISSDEIVVDSTVTYPTQFGTRSVTVTDDLYYWLKP